MCLHMRLESCFKNKKEKDKKTKKHTFTLIRVFAAFRWGIICCLQSASGTSRQSSHGLCTALDIRYSYVYVIRPNNYCIDVLFAPWGWHRVQFAGWLHPRTPPMGSAVSLLRVHLHAACSSAADYAALETGTRFSPSCGGWLLSDCLCKTWRLRSDWDWERRKGAN